MHCRAVAYLKTLDQETHYKLLRYLHENLGMVNYYLKALMSRGLVKARDFKTYGNKRAYLMYNGKLYDLRRGSSI